jgi:hypothetical protein
MKKYIIINGKEAFIIERPNMEAAKTTAIPICDHSNEIIVREFYNITNLTDISKNIIP